MIEEIDFSEFGLGDGADIAAEFGLLDDLTAPIKAAEVSLTRAYGLRPYQAEAMASVNEGWQDAEVTRQMVVLATGCGKTILFSALASSEVAKGGKVLILAHTDELLDQAIDKLKNSTGLKAAKEKANAYASRFDKVVVASVASMQRIRLQTWPKKHFVLIVVDECHRSLADSYQNIFNHFDGRVLGVTATADRGDKRALGDFYQRIAFDYGLIRAVRDGWLVRPIVKTLKPEGMKGIDLKGVKTKASSEGSDFDRMDVAHRIAPFLDAIARAIRTESATAKLIVFLPSIETAQLMSAALNRVGIVSDYVTGDNDPAEKERRKSAIKKYKAGQLQAICNMALLTEGFDHDSIDTLVILRPTKIRSLYAQMVGRGTRPINAIIQALASAADAAARLAIIAASSKPHVTILDFLWLYERHDLIRPASLVSSDPRVISQMAGQDGDLMEIEKKAERDLLKKLESEIRKNANRKEKVIDPLNIAASLGDIELADYEPETARDGAPVSPRQAELLKQFGVALERTEKSGKVTKLVTCYGHAHALISRILARQKAGLASIRQLNFFTKLGIDAKNFTYNEARLLQQQKIAGWAAKRQAEKESKREVDEPQLGLEDLPWVD